MDDARLRESKFVRLARRFPFNTYSNSMRMRSILPTSIVIHLQTAPTTGPTTTTRIHFNFIQYPGNFPSNRNGRAATAHSPDSAIKSNAARGLSKRMFFRVVVVVMKITIALQSFKFQPLTACRNNNINKNQVLIYSTLGALPTIIISQTKKRRELRRIDFVFSSLCIDGARLMQRWCNKRRILTRALRLPYFRYESIF